MYKIFMVKYGNHQTHVAKHLKCGYYNEELKFYLILMNFNLSSHMWLLVTVLTTQI